MYSFVKPSKKVAEQTSVHIDGNNRL